MRYLKSCATIIVALSALNACGRSDAVDQSVQGGGSVADPKTRYDMANGCYALQSVAANAYAVKGGNGSYAATAAATNDGEAFYLKPTALGKYLCYAHDKSMLAVSGNGIGSASAPSDAADWTIDTSSPGEYTLFNKAANKSLATDASGKLVLSNNAGKFKFVATTGCTPYPEMPVGIEGATYKGQGIDKPVLGFADGHTHGAMSSELSDGSGNVGPSAGGALYGMPFHRFGVPEALKNCDVVHGPNGIYDPDTIVRTQLVPHETAGWPTFVGWPTYESNTHQGMYYKWLERAWMAGLRLQVNLGTNINALCEVSAAFITATHPLQPIPDCNDMSIGIKQVKYIKQIQDYVDAQEGGPGKGWYRIVESPKEARKVINDGKLAIVPGVEFADIFDCTVTFAPDGSETRGCTKADIDKKINELYDLGVRQVYPFHDVNSALGGTGIFNGLAINLIGFLQTGAFWKTYDCPDKGEGDKYFYNAGAIMTTAIPGTGSDPLTSAVIAAGGGVLPLYPADKRQCNARGMTDLGRYAIKQIMKKKFVIDIDHAELSIKQEIIDIAKAQNPPYPLVSMHGGHGGITQEQAIDVLKLGGVIFPYNPNGKSEADFVQKVKAIWPNGRPLAVGYGFDGNGFGGYAGPRGAGSQPLAESYQLFSGPGWGPQFANAGIQPITVHRLTIPEGNKSWNGDEVGRAHYGLVADLVEETRIEGGQEAIDALFNSAEAYLQMWEKVNKR